MGISIIQPKGLCNMHCNRFFDGAVIEFNKLFFQFHDLPPIRKMSAEGDADAFQRKQESRRAPADSSAAWRFLVFR